MKKIIALNLFLLASFNFCFSQSEQVPVFISGTDGYKSFRIPAIIRASNNDLLAFCEGRVNSSGDFGDIDIVMKRSSDNGKTWSNLSKVVNYDMFQAYR